DGAGLGGPPLELLAAGEDPGQVARLVELAIAGGRLLQEGDAVARRALGGADGGLELEEPGVDQEVAGAVSEAGGGGAQGVGGAREVAGRQAGLAHVRPGASPEVLHQGRGVVPAEETRYGERQAAETAGFRGVDRPGDVVRRRRQERLATGEEELGDAPGLEAGVDGDPARLAGRRPGEELGQELGRARPLPLQALAGTAQALAE